MDSNSQWQKHRVDERINARRKEANMQRMIKQNRDDAPRAGATHSIVRLPARLVTALFGLG